MITDEELMAYVDGEMDEAGRARVDAALAADAALRARLEQRHRQRALLQEAYAPVLEEPVPTRLVDAVRRPASSVATLAEARQKRASVLRDWRVREWGAIAAALLIGVLIGAPLNGPALVGDDLMARGALARALETQLAADEGAVRIGVTIRTAEGDACRTFAARRGALSGLACREGGAWRVDMLVRGPEQEAGAFRMAAAPAPPALMARVEELADEAGALDARAERNARDNGWRR